jgi:drug/metabolite transporter (DMT)-like permease
MRHNKQKKYWAVLGLLLAMALWGSSFVALKIAFRAYDPMVVIFGRMAVASIGFLMLGRWIVISVRFRWSDLKYMLFMAFCEPCLYFLFEAQAIEHTSASQAGMITAMFPTTRLPLQFELASGMAIIYLGAVITLGAYGLYNFGVKHIPAHQATAYVNLIPVFSVFLGWVVLDESFPWPYA